VILKRIDGFSFPREKRILKAGEFRKVRAKGSRFYSKSFIVYILPNGLRSNRLGITASARVGNSVKRNRVKRLLREFFRLNGLKISPHTPLDIAVYVKRNIDIKAMNLASVEGELAKILIKNTSKPEHG